MNDQRGFAYLASGLFLFGCSGGQREMPFSMNQASAVAGVSSAIPVAGNAGAANRAGAAGAAGVRAELTSPTAGIAGRASSAAGSPGASSAGSSAPTSVAGSSASGTSIAGASGASGNTGDASATAGNTVVAGSSGSGQSPGVMCPTPALKPGDTTRMIAVGGMMRTYVLHVPSKYDGTKPAPLLVDFHPLGGSGPQERQGSPYPAQTDPDGVISAFPSGLAGPSGGAWDVGPCCVANVDDVGFAKALVADVEKTACIDPKRVYAAGFSMGGGMSHYLACHAADVFAAVAPAAFDLLEENIGDCKPARPITVISFRGSSDPIVPYKGGASAVVTGMPITFLGAQGTFEKWAMLNQCAQPPSAANADTCQTYSKCAGGVEVTLCTKQGGSHEPGNASIGWPTLKRFQLP